MQEKNFHLIKSPDEAQKAVAKKTPENVNNATKISKVRQNYFFELNVKLF